MATADPHQFIRSRDAIRVAYLPHEATYDGKPITLDLHGILNLVEKISMAGFEIVFLNADLSRLKSELSGGESG